MRIMRGKKHNPYKKLFEDAIKEKRSNVTIQRSYRTQQRLLIVKAINELIQRDDIQNIHDIGNGNFIIEYEPEVTQ
jgi:phosphoribosylformylglycinamidine (FGAM) synthase-like enzyme